MAWHKIHTLEKRRHYTFPSAIRTNGSFITTPSEMSEAFADTFAESSNQIDSSSHLIYSSPDE